MAVPVDGFLSTDQLGEGHHLCVELIVQVLGDSLSSIVPRFEQRCSNMSCLYIKTVKASRREDGLFVKFLPINSVGMHNTSYQAGILT